MPKRSFNACPVASNKKRDVEAAIAEARESEQQCDKEAKEMLVEAQHYDEVARSHEEKMSAAHARHEATMQELSGVREGMVADMRAFHVAIKAQMQSVGA